MIISSPRAMRAAFALCLGFLATPVWSAELLVLERKGCVWCARFESEIAPVYPKTEEAKLAPLRRVDIDEVWPADLPKMAHDRLTPTFVLVANGKVVGRVRGYPGEDFFWPAIDELLAGMPAR